MLEMALTLIMVAAVGLTFFVVFDWVRWFSAADGREQSKHSAPPCAGAASQGGVFGGPQDRHWPS